MSPRQVFDLVRRDTPVLAERTPVLEAVRAILDVDLPALPVVDDRERYAGIFGEREVIGALFPGYVGSLDYAGFIPRSIERVLEKRRENADEPIARFVTREHVDVAPDAADVSIAETFLHHRVLIVPVVDEGRVTGVVTRGDFFRQLAARLLEDGPER